MYHSRRFFLRSFFSGSLILTGLVACDSSRSPIAPDASGPAPLVEFDVTFGEPPLIGSLRLTPYPTTLGWRYRVDPDAPGEDAQEGILEGPVSIPYRYESLGSHRVRVELTGPDGPVLIEKRLVVVDPASDFEVLDLLPVEEIWPDASTLNPEGIFLEAWGQALYVANYGTGEVVRVDAQTFDLVPDYGARLSPSVEGLAITPSGTRLLAAHKYSLLSVAWLPDPALTWVKEGVGESFVGVIDESHALVSGFPLVIVNLDQRAIEHEAGAFRAGHFAIDRSRGQVFVADRTNHSIHVLVLPTLAGIRTLQLDDFHPTQVALDSDDDKVYVMARDDGGQGWFLVLDAVDGTRLATLSIGSGACSGYCVANPVATFGGGRYVAFEQSSSVLVVDTDTDRPRYRFGSPPVGVAGGPAGVAALPDSDLLYVLGGPYEALTKIRLRGAAGS